MIVYYQSENPQVQNLYCTVEHGKVYQVENHSLWSSGKQIETGLYINVWSWHKTRFLKLITTTNLGFKAW